VTLRIRLALTTIAIGIPLVAAQVWVLSSVREKEMAESLGDLTSSYMRSIGRHACEQAPATWQGGGAEAGSPREPHDGPPLSAETRLFGHGPPPPLDRPPPLPEGPPPNPAFDLDRPPPPPHETVLYAYDSTGVSLNPQAPRLDPRLWKAVADGAPIAHRETTLEGRPAHEVLVRMPWSPGPCAVVLAQRMEPWNGARGWPGLGPWLPPLATVLLSVLLAAGPIVSRLRRLSSEVKRAAGDGYRHPFTTDGADEIGELGRAFLEAGREIRAHLEELEAREKTLRDFLENTTHDVMIPLTVLQGHLASLRQAAQEGRAAGGETISAAMGEAHYIGSLLHNLAAAAKLDSAAPQLQRSRVNLNDLVARVVGRHLPIARQNDVDIERALEETPIWVDADVTLIEQAVSNVVYNAVRHNRPGGHVAVILERSTGSGRFGLRVIDDGPGVPDAEREQLFTRHFRGNAARTRDPGGHGLGLSIASRAVELHGWTLLASKSEFGGLELKFDGPALPDVAG